MRSLVRSLIVVSVAASLPIVAACGGLVESGPEGTGSTPTPPTTASGTTTTSSATTTATTTPSASVGDRFGKTLPGSGPYPCTAGTNAYYTAPTVPTSGTACHEIFRREVQVPPGTIVSIVSPYTPPGTCAMTECICGATGKWQPESAPACAWW